MQVTLAAGEAICLPANHIHAYVSGQLLECMATSDNVINAAFTGGGERQGKLMCETLCYSTSAPTTLAGESITSHIKVTATSPKETTTGNSTHTMCGRLCTPCCLLTVCSIGTLTTNRILLRVF